MSDWRAWADDWTIHLRARGCSAATIKVYLQGLANLAEWARARGIDDPRVLRPRDLERYFADFRERKHKTTGRPITGAYVRKDYASLRQFFKWLAREERTPDVMDDVRMPKVEAKRIEVLEVDQLRALLAACDGTDFVARRDAAMIRVLFDCGVRRGEIMTLRLVDVDLIRRTLAVKGKTGPRLVPFGHKTAEAISRYLRARVQHKDRDLDALWLATSPHRGAMGVDGLRQMLNRRATAAGVSKVHPHRFRHTAYDAFVDAGGDGTTAMTLFGWSTRSMLDHYARSNAEKRAIAAAHRLSPGDRI